MKVTRIAYSHRLNPGKYAALVEQARRLRAVRSEVWQRYGSIAGAGLKDPQVRDAWLAEGTHHRFGVPANAWKETVRDAMGDIAANRESAKVKARRAVRRHTNDPAAQKRLFTALKADRWADDPYLARQMRKHCKRGKNRTFNQIVVRADQHNTVEDGSGRLWLSVPGLVQRKPVKIPLNTTVAPAGTLRLILRNNRVEIHYQIDAGTIPTSQRPCGTRTIGVDKATPRPSPTPTATTTAPGWANCSPRSRITARPRAAPGPSSARSPTPPVSAVTKRVKQILRERADRHRTRLPVQDSSRPPRWRRAKHPICSAMSNE